MPLIRKDATTPNPPPPVGGDLTAALASNSADERWRAVRGLAVSSEGVQALGRALRTETDSQVREAIFTSLARAGTAEAAQLVLPHLRSDDSEIRTGALDALRAMPSAVRPQLAGLLEDPDSDVRLLACEIVRGLSGPDAVGLLGGLLEREAEANVCGAAVEVLAEIGDASVLPALEHCAARFEREPFLLFAIKVARERIGAIAADRRG
jgi:HEAT repeat protein